MPLTPDAVLAMLTVAELPRVGERRLHQLQELTRQWQVPLDRLADLPATALRQDFALPEAAIRRLQDERPLHEARCAALADALLAAGARLCPADDSQYPRGWARHGDPPPPLAYLYGEPKLLQLRSVALLHSRVIDAETVTATLRLARAVATAGLCLVVGGMKTTHRLAAATARSLGAARLIVLDRGLLAAFHGQLDRDPFGLGPRRTAFDPRRSLVVTPFRPDDHAVPRSGRRRDALIAALADLVVALQARPGGEIEQVCLRALARGQTVAVWQGHNPRLLAAGAVPLWPATLDAELAALLRPESARPR